MFFDNADYMVARARQTELLEKAVRQGLARKATRKEASRPVFRRLAALTGVALHAVQFEDLHSVSNCRGAALCGA